MKINNLGYLFKEGFKGIFTHGFMSFAAIFVTVACLLIVGSFSILMYNVGVMVDELNQTNEVMVYVDEALSESDAKSVGTKINLIENVQQATFKSREEALEDFVADHQGDDAFSGVVAEDLRHRFVVTLVDNSLIHDTVNQIQQIEGVAKVSASFELAEGFSTLEDVLNIIFAVVLVGLGAVSLVIISNTVKISVYDRRDEIGIMKMVGATNGFIRLPFVVEGLTLGMAGAGIAFGLEWLLYDMLVKKIEAMDSLQMFNFVPFQQLLMPMICIFAATGFLVGVLGSWSSIKKFMNV
jgi:cell division transport system permease protein